MAKTLRLKATVAMVSSEPVSLGEFKPGWNIGSSGGAKGSAAMVGEGIHVSMPNGGVKGFSEWEQDPPRIRRPYPLTVRRRKHDGGIRLEFDEPPSEMGRVKVGDVDRVVAICRPILGGESAELVLYNAQLLGCRVIPRKLPAARQDAYVLLGLGRRGSFFGFKFSGQYGPHFEMHFGGQYTEVHTVEEHAVWEHKFGFFSKPKSVTWWHLTGEVAAADTAVASS